MAVLKVQFPYIDCLDWKEWNHLKSVNILYPFLKRESVLYLIYKSIILMLSINPDPYRLQPVLSDCLGTGVMFPNLKSN